MKRVTLTVFIISVFSLTTLFGQSQSGCTVSFPNNFNTPVNISDIYDPSQCPSGDLVLNNVNSNGAASITFDEDITLNSLSIIFKNGANPAEVIIPAGVTVNITTDLVMDLNSTVQDKFLQVDGNLIVGETIDFGDINLEIDGSGTISADDIVGASGVKCTSDDTGTPDCPTISSNTCDDGGSGACGSESLPIELAQFDVAVRSSSAVVSWVTATEENNDYFTIERSKDGVEFESIGTVAGAGNSNSALKYNFVDESPLFGKSYYRLRQTDFDGKSETFSPKSIYRSNVENLVIQPNPVNRGTKLTIYTGAEEGENLELSIFTASGINVMSQSISASEEIEISSEIEPGLYVVKIKSGTNQHVKRLLIR